MAVRTRFAFTTSLTSRRAIRDALRKVGFSTVLIERKGSRLVVETEAEGEAHLQEFQRKMARAGFGLEQEESEKR
jgi:hypothetical protein